MKLKATSFATRQDLAAFAHAVVQGKSPREALSVGDNGVGAYGDATWRITPPAIVALARSVASHNQVVSVKLLDAGHGNEFDAVVRDIAPAGIVDLNPAALIAAGLMPDTELSATAVVTLRAPNSA